MSLEDTLKLWEYYKNIKSKNHTRLFQKSTATFKDKTYLTSIYLYFSIDK